MIREVSLLLLVLLFFAKGHSQSPTREFRGVWVATVANIDWPSKPGLSVMEQQNEFKALLEMHKANGMNAVIVQVRPSADAFYESRYEPWSRWLTGKIGIPPSPYYDPLKFMIEEAHQRGLEFHAWFNPYRAVVDLDKNGIDSASVAFRNPELMVKYGNNLYFDPGLPNARQHTKNVIMEVVNRYAVDGIHFDDYFYPYKIKDLEFPDSSSFALFGRAFANKDDWRRENVSLLIKEISDSIRSVKPYVQFGISPFGVWRNQSKDSTGSATQAGQTCYDDLYADILKWQKEKWIDYVLPQIYWPIGFEVANYEVIAKWWNKNSYGVPVYIGQATYRIGGNTDERWKDPSQLLKQIRLNRSLPNILGSAYFSSKSFKANPLGVNDSLRTQYYKRPALPPAVIASTISPARDYPIEFIGAVNGITLLWRETLKDDVLNRHHRYAIYRKHKGIIEMLASLPSLTDYTIHSFTDVSAKRGKKYQYAVTSLDIYNGESSLVFSPVIINRKSFWKVLIK